jgi:hypothetical protein
MDDLKFLSDRDADIWMPLFAVCTVAAPERSKELKRCAETLSGAKAADDVEDSLKLKLLADTRKVWSMGGDRLPTEILLKRLNELAESPWAALSLDAIKLAGRFRPFGVASRQIRIGTKTVKGYLWVDLNTAFERYLPPCGDFPETPETNHVNTGEYEDS